MGQCVSQSNHLKPKDQKHHISKPFKINDFHFVKLIGKGGFSKVWKVQQKKSGKIYAIKVMDKAKIIAKKCVKAVIEERKILSHLTHAGDLSKTVLSYIYQSITYREILYVTILTKVLHQLKHKQVRMLNNIELLILALLRTLQCLYEYQIIHKDIKPQNILFDREGVPFLTDFGSASYYQEDNSDDVSGTVGYMSPQVMQSQSHTFAADYYAVGIITFQLFLKKRPYLSHKKQEILKQIRKKPINAQNFPQLKTINPQAQDFIISLLKKKQQERLGYKEGIIELFNHPWLSAHPNQINIHNELVRIKSLFQSQEHPEIQINSVDSQQTQQNETKYGKILERDHVQEMFQGFNSCQSIEKSNPQRNKRKSSCQILQKLQTTHSLKKFLNP